MTHDRINLRRRKQEGTPECQINLRNRKAIILIIGACCVFMGALGVAIVIRSVDRYEDQQDDFDTRTEDTGK